MKMSEIDHTNSLDPDQAQQNVWQDQKEKGLRWNIWNTLTRVGCMT